MSETEPTSRQLLEDYRQGDQQAAAALFLRYAERLIALARGHLSRKLAQKVDPEDVMLSAFRSFFLRARDGQYTLQQSGDLWKLLARITVCKVRRQAERFRAGKRDATREQTLLEEAEFLAREPTPEAAAILADELQLLFRTRARAEHRRMAELYLLEGLQAEEIADQTGYTGARVRQVLKEVRAWLQKREESFQQSESEVNKRP